MLDVSASPVSMLADEMEKTRWLADGPGALSAHRDMSFATQIPTDADCSQARSMAVRSLQVRVYSLTRDPSCRCKDIMCNQS